ncbi:MAG: fucose-binding lectin protein [Alphaproteobacteria bacterium]|jgi:hypothetical protein|nr:MAG: fucose-binding lectin protein [Alphaproteobacteria bacterium]
MSNSFQTAAVSWFDEAGNLHIRVYSSDGYKVTEMCLDGPGGWFAGSFNQPGDHVSATCWQQNGYHVRVYCSFEGKCVEWSLDEGVGWTKGKYPG